MSNLTNSEELIKKLRRIEDRFNFLIQHLCDDFIEVNIQTGECWMTHTKKNFVSKSIYKDQIEWFAENLIVEEEREAYLADFELQNLLATLRKNDGFYKVTYSAIYPDGIVNLLIVSALIQDSFDRTNEYIISYAQDITELRQHEEQNRKLIDISQQLLNISQHDALTKLYNRTAAESVILDHIQKDNSTSSGTLLLIDIDHFKQINDDHGHIVGDHALKYLSNVMRDVFRSDDILCRWGGDEFLVFMRNIDNTAAIQSRVERLLHKMKNYKTNGLEMRITLSIGIVIGHEKSTLDGLFKQADEVLYQVKSNGRNGYIIEPAK